MDRPKVVIGFITYGARSRQYLASFLAGLKSQTFTDYQLLALDNSPSDDNANVDFLRQTDGDIKIIKAEKNLGFGAGFNRLIDQAQSLGAEYFLVVNADTVWQPRALELLVTKLDAAPELGSASPKVWRWDFAKQTFTKTIDTCGLRVLSGLHFVDIGQGETDAGQYDTIDILGPSGCAGLFRLRALEQIKEGARGYFDENFFMYKEDCDLAYRLRLKNWPSALVSQAIVYHDRHAAGQGESLAGSLAARQGKSRQVKQWSFYSQHLLLAKYWRYQNFWNKVLIIGREILMLAYVLVFEPYLLAELAKIKKLKI
jgi:GT2 family glycosyltransferase